MPRRRCALALVAGAAAGAGLLARGASAQEGPYEGVAAQLLEEECPSLPPSSAPAWRDLTVTSLEARTHLGGHFGPESRAAALAHYLQALLQLLGQDIVVAFQCSALAARHLQVVAEWSLALDQPLRARVLLQLGNAFKFQAFKEWAQMAPVLKQQADAAASTKEEAAAIMAASTPASQPKTFLPRLHVEYQIALGELHEALKVQPQQLQRAPTSSRGRVEVHSICNYKPDPTSKTGLDSPLPDLSVPNHRAYSERHGYRYVLHTQLPLPDREAHYSKMLVVLQRFAGADLLGPAATATEASPPPDWILFVDCDAFFTNFDVSVEDLLETYAKQPHASGGGQDGESGVQFLVAEDPGGINTGVFLIRNSDWSLNFLARVAKSLFTVAWDQSMFFWEIVKGALDMDLGTWSADFQYPPQVRLLHQAHFNAFVPPASRDWMAHEWQPGDFVRHFAGCPWQEEPCLRMMRETVGGGAAGLPERAT